MKLIKLSVGVLLVTAIVMVSCKSNPTKDKLVKTWKLMGMAGAGADNIPDSIKQEMYGTRFMEFKDNGAMIASGGKSRMMEGTYTLSADGKKLFTTIRERPSDTLLIDKLTKDTLVIGIKKDNMQWIMIPQ